jgi:Fe-S-cluster containining protein
MRASWTGIRYSQPVGFRFPSAGDRRLIQIVDAALAEATGKSGDWLACRPGCTQCCSGVFPISQLDRLRLERGLAELEAQDRPRAEAIRKRARESLARIAADFPGDRNTGILAEGDRAQERFADYANDELCPVLDPATGRCELYDSRPMTCRVFGPPVRSEAGLGVCELCFQGATDEQIAACEMVPDPGDLESKLTAQLERQTGHSGRTIVSFCLAS